MKMERITKILIVVIASALLTAPPKSNAKKVIARKNNTNTRSVLERLQVIYPFDTWYQGNDVRSGRKGYFEAQMPEDLKGRFKALSLVNHMVIPFPKNYGCYYKVGIDGSKGCVISPLPSSNPFKNWMVIRYDDDGACAGCSQGDASEYFQDVQPFSGERPSPRWNKTFDHGVLLGDHLLFAYDWNWQEGMNNTVKYGHIGIIYYNPKAIESFHRLIIDFTPTRVKDAMVIMMNYLKELGLKPEQFKHAIKIIKSWKR
jgi:hypothetical protein